MASPILDKIQKIPAKTRAIAFGILVAVIAVVYIWQSVIPNNTAIDQLRKSIAEIQAKIRENDAKIKKLDDLKSEVRSLQKRLVVLTEQLPPESEVSGLLKQIQGLVNQSALVLKLWKPDIKGKEGPSGLYKEIPVSMTLIGGYHNTAMFFDRVSKLTRIVNISNIKMGGAKRRPDGAIDIDITCIATTFSALEKKVEAPKPAKKTQ
jgi:type IV pilus assembly protein PilO